jgi:hypothetical protein
MRFVVPNGRRSVLTSQLFRAYSGPNTHTYAAAGLSSGRRRFDL